MRIKSRVRGTNQYGAKGELIGAGWCEKHGFWDKSPIVDMNGFPMVQRVDNCPKCKLAPQKEEV